MHTGKLFGVLFASAVLLSGCGGAGTAAATPTPPLPTPFPAAPTVLSTTESPEPAPDSETAAVPQAVLSTSAGRSQTAATGSYCWGEGDAFLCTDTAGLPAPSSALEVQPGENVTFTLGAEGATLVTMRVLGWQPDPSFPSEEGTTVVALDAPLLATGDFTPGSTIGWQAPPEQGEYLLDMSTVYGEQGSIAYGWHIIVR